MIGIRLTSLLVIATSAAMAQQPAHIDSKYAYVTSPVFEQGDPADSMYRVARDFLNRGDWGRAAKTFKDIGTKYPRSTYAADLPYFEAFVRYRIGTTEELRTAAKLLEPRASRLIGGGSAPAGNLVMPGRRTPDADVVGLYVQINKALATRGDNNAAATVARAAQAGLTCDREEMSTKAEAISALSQMDPASATSILQGVLAKRDDCSVDLRRSAVFVLGRRGDSLAAALLADAAKLDPSTEIRVNAIAWLPKVQGDAGVNMLEELLRADTNQRIQRAVVRTLTASDNARARASMRALIDRKDAATSLRIEAVNAFNTDRASLEDVAFLRALYPRVDNELVKNALVNTIGRLGGTENDQWLLALARSPNEPSQFRAAAMARLIRSNTPIADLTKLYEISDSYETRMRIVNNLDTRREPEANEKLFDIYRTTTELRIKSQVIQALIRRKDPRGAQLMQELFEVKKP
jgi:hypothetical protein